LKDKKIKQFLYRNGCQWEGRVNRKGERSQIWGMSFAYMYENIAIQLVKIILRRRKER
jgi:hypothetical protein